MKLRDTAGQFRISRERGRDAAVLLFIAAFFTLFFNQFLFGDKFIVGGDAFAYSYPLRTVGWEMLRQGQLPLWTPLVLSGYPLLSMSQLAFAYPLTWGHLFLPGHWAEQIYVLAPFLLSPAFTYAYAREVGRSRAAALLAGLAFGYGGATIGLLGVVGFFTNAMMWLPLMLVAIERARAGRRFASCLSAASFAYAMSVLTGLAQGFVYVALVAVAYAIWLALFDAPRLPGSDASPEARETDAQEGAMRSWSSRAWTIRRRWQPVAVAAGAVAFGAGVGAFQILETMRAVRRSIRRTLIYPFFVSGSFSPRVALKSLAAPLYTERFADVGTYVAPLVMLLACVSVLHALRRTTTITSSAPRRDRRVLFWAATALVSFVFILGQHTPVYGWLYHLPVVNSFRVPSRFAFVWTFAAAILAAYGWDALVARPQALTGVRASARRWNVALVCGLFALSALVGFFWWRETVRAAITDFDARAGVPRAWTEGFWYAGLPLSSYLNWKLAFTALTLLVIWRGAKIDSTRARTVVLACALALVCSVEPFVVVSNCWQTFAKPRTRFDAASPVTRFLQTKTRADGDDPPARVYTRVKLFAEEFDPTPRFDPPNLTALYGLQNTGGYEPLIFERYSRALGNVHLDAASPLPGFAPNLNVFDARSHLLDLLGVRFVVNAEMPTGAPAIEREGVRFNPDELATELRPGEKLSLEVSPAAAATADTLALVTSMSNSTAVADDATVADILIHTKDGRVFERQLRAGRDTSEWAHERPDVRASVRHALAPVFDSNAVEDAGGRYSSHRYWTRIALGESLEVERVEIVNTADAGTALALWKATLYDTARRESQTLARTQRSLYAGLDAARWSVAYDAEDVLVLENRRALPRAWLVGAAESVDGEEALRRINGESTHNFDPWRTALLEVAPAEMPALTGGELAAGSTARIVEYEPNRIVVETNADRAALLVLGEINYPGWEATVDGAAAEVHATNYLLRGVYVPAGAHRVEMRYTAPAARNGAFISILSLLVLGGLLVCARRKKGTTKPHETTRRRV
ncbi:MAG TPA: YfhO family protein [Pyrinomonadaceae bacterium]|nr:YfhO family protein [Pyrinomonadaceae bacterium]